MADIGVGEPVGASVGSPDGEEVGFDIASITSSKSDANNTAAPAKLIIENPISPKYLFLFLKKSSKNTKSDRAHRFFGSSNVSIFRRADRAHRSELFVGMVCRV